MRFEAVELVRYGHFSGRELRFPRDECDFHLILGHNEAGKSTLRQAFHDLLFGIPMNTPMSFLHPGSELEIRALLSGASGELAFSRRRKQKGGLFDAHGEPLPADALRSWLGDVGEAFYERMFGLDHRRLEQGGRAMLQAGDNVDSVLFQAAAGVSALNGVLESLHKEADSLWAPRRSRDRAWYVAATRLDEADAALRAATVRPSTWLEARRETSRLERAFSEAEAAHRKLLSQVRELERLRRSAPLLAQIRQYESMLAEGRAAEDAQRRERLLACEGDILSLNELRTRVGRHRSGIADAETRMELLGHQLADVWRQLGRAAPASLADRLEALGAELPPRPLRREIEQLLQEGRQRGDQCAAARKALEERRSELDRLQTQIAALPAVSVSRPLRLALDAVVAAGDIEAMCAAARRNHEREGALLLRRLQALSQSGFALPSEPEEAIRHLRDMEAWPAATLVEQSQQRQHLRADIETLEQRIREAGLERGAAALALEQFRRSHQAVSRDDVLQVRRERDALWSALSTGKASMEGQAAQFGRLLQHADSLADLHLQAVGDAARLQALEHELERCETAHQGLRSALDAAAAALASHEAAWAQACEARRLPVLPPAELQAWLAARADALQAHEAVLLAQHEAETLDRRHASLLDGLLDVLAQEGESPEGHIREVRAGEGQNREVLAQEGHIREERAEEGRNRLSGLAEARERATAMLHDAERTLARRQALGEQLAHLETLLPALQRQSEHHEAEHSAWLSRWHDALARAGLPVGAEAAYVEAALDLFGHADELLSKMRECGAERDRMMQELEHYARAAVALAQSLHDAGFDPADTDPHVRRWLAQLEHARAVEREKDEATRRLAELTESLIQQGEGRSRAQIESELDAVDVSTLANQSETAGAALEEAAAASNRLAVECEQARNALDAISGDDTAARAEARRQEAIADMTEVAERYVGVYAQYRLLERVMERYRERRQGPLLARAGELFSELTLGAHSGLSVDADADSLQARRADGGLVPLDGLSDGTRDQLYLALRLAALELYLDNAAPMPFIADDLFVNYDDRRALAGLARLGDISRRTQVVFLTHHAHMAELAQQALRGKLHVIELPQSDQARYTGSRQ